MKQILSGLAKIVKNSPRFLGQIAKGTIKSGRYIFRNTKKVGKKFMDYYSKYREGKEMTKPLEEIDSKYEKYFNYFKELDINEHIPYQNDPEKVYSLMKKDFPYIKFDKDRMEHLYDFKNMNYALDLFDRLYAENVIGRRTHKKLKKKIGKISKRKLKKISRK